MNFLSNLLFHPKVKAMEKNKSKKTVSAIPEGFHSVTPYLVADNSIKLIEFMKNAFGGEVTFILQDDNKRVVHAAVKIGNSIIMLSDTMEGMESQTSMLFIYVEDVDAVYKKAVQAKAKPIREPLDEFYGDRAGCVKDEWGNTWWVATHIEDVDKDELERRSKQAEKERQEKGDAVHA
jgi:PhnB protein